MTKVNTMA